MTNGEPLYVRAPMVPWAPVRTIRTSYPSWPCPVRTREPNIRSSSAERRPSDAKRAETSLIDRGVPFAAEACERQSADAGPRLTAAYNFPVFQIRES